MKERGVPGLGDFAVVVSGDCEYVCIHRTKQMDIMLQGQWVPELMLYLRHRLKWRGSVVRVGAAKACPATTKGNWALFKITPAQASARPHKKHKGRNRPIQVDTWRAIKAYLRRRRRQLKGVVEAKHRRKTTEPVRRQPAGSAMANQRVYRPAYGRR